MIAPAADKLVYGLAGLSWEAQARLLERRRRFPNIEDAIERLCRTRDIVTSAVILHNYGPDRLPNHRLDSDLLIDAQNHPGVAQELIVNALDVLGKQIPILSDQMEEYYMEDGHISIIVDPQGACWTYDEFYEVVDRPDSYLDSSSSAMPVFFALCLINRIDVSFWYDIQECFPGWPDIDERVLSASVSQIDEKKFYRLLDKKGYSEWKTVFKMAWFACDSPFFDFDMESAYQNTIPYTSENIQNLIEQWAADQSIVMEYQAAVELWRHNPYTFDHVLAIWEKCLETDRPGRANRTLAEVWGDQPERIIDPFYGPLDGQDEDLMEPEELFEEALNTYAEEQADA